MQRATISFRSPPVRHRRARAGWRLVSITALLFSLLLYATAPLATLWRAADSIRTHDVEQLRVALDWRSVRDGLKQDMADKPALALAKAEPMDELPAFGASFATSVVSHAIDNEVTPETLISMLSPPGGAGNGGEQGWRAMFSRVAGLRFTGLTRFDAEIRPRGENSDPVLVSLRLSQWRWRITRLHLPADEATTATRTDRT